MQTMPTLYSFRRCPYAMRARLAILVAGVPVELREILLRDKPQAFLDVSPSATVPCLVDGQAVIDESLEVMVWALGRNDPHGWLDMPLAGEAWIARNDGPFKQALDRTKYGNRYPGTDTQAERAKACQFLHDLNGQISQGWLFGKPTLADYALLPFVRQFAFIDKAWFDDQPWPRVQAWLGAFLASPAFITIMEKVPTWQEGNPPRLMATVDRAN